MEDSARKRVVDALAALALDRLLLRRRVSSTQRVAALLLDRGGKRLQPQVRRHEDVGHLLASARCAADEAPDDLAEEELGARGRRVDAHAQARDVDALGDHQHADEPRLAGGREGGDAVRWPSGRRR